MVGFDDTVYGCAVITHTSDESMQAGHLQLIAVYPEYRDHTGIGSRLLGAVVSEVLQDGHRQMILTARPGSEQFYTQFHGYN